MTAEERKQYDQMKRLRDAYFNNVAGLDLEDKDGVQREDLRASLRHLPSASILTPAPGTFRGYRITKEDRIALVVGQKAVRR